METPQTGTQIQPILSSVEHPNQSTEKYFGRRGRGKGRGMGKGRGHRRDMSFCGNERAQCHRRGRVIMVCCCGSTLHHENDHFPSEHNECTEQEANKKNRRNVRMEEFRQQYETELEYLQSEGFLRERLNLRILIKQQGDLEKTVERLNEFRNARKPFKKQRQEALRQ